MKKLNRKLIPAFAMLLLSAVLMSTASFAWFSSNGKVTATGMAVSATAPAALWISDKPNEGFGTAITLSSATGQIAPVTNTIAAEDNETALAANWKFHILTENGYAAVKNDGSVNGTLADLTEEDKDNANVWAQAFYLRLEGKNSTEAYAKKPVSATVKVTSKNGSNDKIYQALRVAFVVDDLSKNNAASSATTYTTGGFSIVDIPNSLMAVPEGSPAGTKPSVSASSDVFMNLAAQETVKVQVYVWFEGTDSACINANSQSLDFYNIDLEFVAGATTEVKLNAGT